MADRVKIKKKYQTIRILTRNPRGQFWAPATKAVMVTMEVHICKGDQCEHNMMSSYIQLIRTHCCVAPGLQQNLQLHQEADLFIHTRQITLSFYQGLVAIRVIPYFLQCYNSKEAHFLGRTGSLTGGGGVEGVFRVQTRGKSSLPVL